jgi:hypothetical protein
MMAKTAKRPLTPLQVTGLLAFSVVVGYPSWLGVSKAMWGGSSNSIAMLSLLGLLAAVTAVLIVVSDGAHQSVKSLKNEAPRRRDNSS